MNATSEQRKIILQELIVELNAKLPLLSKAKVESIQTLVSHFYIKTWKRNRKAKYGSINKGFTDEELAKFLGAIKEPRWKLLFEYQAYEGLRIGEACVVNVKDFDFNTRELRVRTEKAHTLDVMVVPQFLFDETLAYIREHSKEIDSAQGYLFYPDRAKSHENEPYVNLNYARKIFRYYASLAGLNEVYDKSEESKGRRTRNLHRLTTHSLRHHAITAFSRAVNGNVVLTNRFARHSRDSIGVTMRYINTSKSELYSAIEKAFTNQSVVLNAQ